MKEVKEREKEVSISMNSSLYIETWEVVIIELV